MALSLTRMFDVWPAWVQVLNSVSMYVPAIRAFLFLQQENVMHSPEVHTNTNTYTTTHNPTHPTYAAVLHLQS